MFTIHELSCIEKAGPRLKEVLIQFFQAKLSRGPLPCFPILFFQLPFMPYASLHFIYETARPDQSD